ncbi:MAG: hypothetical protein HY072_08665 [Deltaproteobacteria bacterium]|nr:hypothetical protein [Deltaproteobacteria bacterium]
MVDFKTEFKKPVSSARNLLKKMKWLVFGAAFIGLGISMPSCPGQQALQQQVETLQTKLSSVEKQSAQRDSQMKQLIAEVSQLRSILSQLNNIVGAQNISIKELESKMSPKSRAMPKHSDKKKGK